MIKLHKNAKNITNKKFGRLTAIIPIKNNKYGVYWKCKCICGKIVNVLATRLIKGTTKSCGCLLKDIMKTRNQKGKNNPNYKSGESLKIHYCIKCKTNPISFNNWLYGKKYCKECYKKTLKGNGNPNFKNDNTHNNRCIDCGKHISKQSKRCQNCAGKINGKNQRGKLNHRFGKPPTHGKRIKYKGIKMRSSWEIAYAKYLDKNKIKWQYEPKTFDLGDTTYTPDFYLPETDTYVEIKGYWRDDAKKKFKMFQKKYYSMNIVLLTKKELKKLRII
jgi:hypothetical protein